MSKITLFIFTTLLGTSALATVDAMTNGWIVIQDIQEEGSFSVTRVPIIGCYGVPQGPQLEQFVSEFKVKSTVGCGSHPDVGMENINALSCAKIVESIEGKDYMSFKRITLDISACPYKNNKEFITMVRTAAARNFPQYLKGKYVSKPEVDLVLLK